jgi:hypothetical protein
MDDLLAIVPYFNPCHFHSRKENYKIFAERLRKQNIRLFTVECAFRDDPWELPNADLKLRSPSILWMKERLINEALSQSASEYVSWLDADILLPDNWAEDSLERLAAGDFVQPFGEMCYLKPRVHDYGGEFHEKLESVSRAVWQPPLRVFPIPFTGGAWVTRRKTLELIDGIYDREIVGAGDLILADCFLHQYLPHIHTTRYYWKFGSEKLREDILRYTQSFLNVLPRPVLHFLPSPAYHLYHGTAEDRQYTQRLEIIQDYAFDPRTDIEIREGVFEWATFKSNLHQAVEKHFNKRKEDTGFYPVLL